MPQHDSGGAGNKLRMKAVVFHGAGDIRIDDVEEPRIVHDQDALIDVTSSAICGTDLHFIRGSMEGVEEGKILGHEAVGIVREIGKGTRAHGCDGHAAAFAYSE